MARELPNVYTELNDLSALIEADDSLTIGITLQANRGPIGEACNVTDSSDFLTKYTFSGKPGAKQDSTYFDILELLKVTNNIWVSRAANNPLYGGLVVKKVKALGEVVGVDADAITVKGDVKDAIKAGEEIIIADIGRYCVKEVAEASDNTKVTLTEKVEVPEGVNAAGKAIRIAAEPQKLTDMVLATAIKEVKEDKKTIVIDGRVAEKFSVGDRVKIGDIYATVKIAEYDNKIAGSVITFEEDLGELAAGDVKICRDSIANPDLYAFGEDELFLITGIDQGAYNNQIAVRLTSSEEAELDEKDCFKLEVLIGDEPKEEYLVSMNLTKKSTDGTNMFIKNIINGKSDYIKVITPEDADIQEDEIPASNGAHGAYLGGGFDGGAVRTEDHDYNIDALEVFASKMVPVSILVNGDNDSADYQQTMVNICASRKDCFCFLRTPKNLEKTLLPAQRVKNIVSYKKETLAPLIATGYDYLGCMFGPHAYVQDSYNSRKVKIGMDSLACKQYLKVINSDGYPYAAAGPIKGKMSGLTLDWKIGDESTEASFINDASINFLVFEPRQQYYYLNTQNTLQMANSAFRNIGAVLNVLNMKENLARRLKDFVNLPITDALQEQIIRTMEQYMDGCKSSGRVSNYHLSNNTTKNDISNNELHFLLTLAPAYYAQRIYLVVNVVNAAFDFELLQSN